MTTKTTKKRLETTAGDHVILSRLIRQTNKAEPQKDGTYKFSLTTPGYEAALVESAHHDPSHRGISVDDIATRYQTVLDHLRADEIIPADSKTRIINVDGNHWLIIDANDMAAIKNCHTAAQATALSA